MIKYCQYGSGFSNPNQFINFDASPTLRIQKLPLLGSILKTRMSTKFPSNIVYGDIIKGLPIEENSMKGIYCSHVLEHLSLDDLRIALNNTYKKLQVDGVFRCVLPDLEWSCNEYLNLKKLGDDNAGNMFMDNFTMLGQKSRPKKITEKIRSLYGNSEHLWMWDFESLKTELEKAGFTEIRRAKYNDSSDDNFNFVEEESRFINCLAIECKKK
jgi:predicted SAM-dependent methyltransferase